MDEVAKCEVWDELEFEEADEAEDIASSAFPFFFPTTAA